MITRLGLKLLAKSLRPRNPPCFHSERKLPGLVPVLTIQVRRGQRGPLKTIYEYAVSERDAMLQERRLGIATRILLAEGPLRGRPRTWPAWRMAMLVHEVALFMTGHYKSSRDYQLAMAAGGGDVKLRSAAIDYLSRLYPETKSALSRRYFFAKKLPGVVDWVEGIVPGIAGRI